MKLKHFIFAVAVRAVGATEARAQGNFSDTSIGFRDGWSQSNVGGLPATAREVNKAIVNLGYFDTSTLTYCSPMAMSRRIIGAPVQPNSTPFTGAG